MGNKETQTGEPQNGPTETQEVDVVSTFSSKSSKTSRSSRPTIWQYLAMASKKLDSLGVETRGIERIEPWERSTNKYKQFISVVGLWLSGCGGLSSMSSFYLGPLLFGLGLKDCLIAGLAGETLGCAIAAYCAMMGPRSGCRQMVSARFLFGWWFVKLVCLVSIVGVMGWSVVNSVVGGQILASISNGKISLTVGIVIIAVLSLSVAIFGIKQLLRIETYLSLPVNIAFLLLYVVSSQKFDHLTWENAIADPSTVRGNFLTFFSLCYAITSTWGSIASDYYILFPENTGDLHIYCLTFVGIWVPTTFVGLAGTLIGNVALSYKPWGAAYDKYGMGGLLNEAFKPWGGGGKFLLILIYLSLISNNILNTYSAAFGVQLAGRGFAKIPRWLWAFVLTAVYLVCALAGKNKFATILGNFLPMVGYWISIYFMLLLQENFIFRSDRFIHLYTKEFSDVKPAQNIHLYTPRKQNYNFAIWNDYDKLTHGIAATVSFLVGAVGAAVGMAQTYWTGPIARRLGSEEGGGDIAMWLCMGFAGVAYPALRYFELKKYGR